MCITGDMIIGPNVWSGRCKHSYRMKMPFQISLLDAKIHARVRRPVFTKSVNALMTKTNLESIVVKSIEVDKKDKGVANNKDPSKNEYFKRNQHVLEKENSDSVAIRSDQNEKGSVKI